MDLEANSQNGFHCLMSVSLHVLAKSYTHIEHFHPSGKATVCNNSLFTEWLSTKLPQGYFPKYTDLLKEDSV